MKKVKEEFFWLINLQIVNDFKVKTYQEILQTELIDKGFHEFLNLTFFSFEYNE